MASNRSIWPLAVLFVLALVAFGPLALHPDQTLYSDTNDLLAEHLPAKLFLVRAFDETGELPLWNPEQYAGSPFVHDIQVGLFYPPHLPLYFMPGPAVGPFLSWLVWAHVLLAGWLMYAYARHAGMGRLAAFTTGAGYMLAPRWLMQLFVAGHTVTVGLAWLPLVMLCVERAIAGRSWRWAVGGGLAYALLVLGTHPQWTFYASLLVGVWPWRLMTRAGAGPGGEGPELNRPMPAVAMSGPSSYRRFAARWLLVELVVVVTGIALCAVQLFPTLEAAGQTSRSRGMAQSWGLTGAMAAATSLVGPAPEAVAEPIHWEARGAIGFTWAVVGLAAWRLGGRRARWPALVTVGVLAFALGGSLLLEPLPGFSTFRMPTRALLTLTFPLAILVGFGVDGLAAPGAVRRPLARASAVVVGVAAGPGLLNLAAGEFPHWPDLAPGWVVYWPLVAGAWAALLAILPALSPARRSVAVALVLVVDLLAFVVPYPDVRPAADVFPHSPLADYIRGHNPDGQRTYDPETEVTLGGNLLGVGGSGASVYGIPSVRGYNPLDVARVRQFLAYVADIQEPQRAFASNFTHPVTEAFPVKNRKLLDLLGTRYLITTPDNPMVDPTWVPRATDPAPRVYAFPAGGIRDLPPLTAYENTTVLPRAFMVSRAEPEAGEADVLAQLVRTDLHTAATLADWEPDRDPVPNGAVGPVALRSHRPNRIDLELDGESGGLLVLTDPWYPGWKCWVDGTEVPIWKADYAFRGVMVPSGAREVVFRFEPRSYRVGRVVSLAMLGVVLLAFLVAVAFNRPARSAPAQKTHAR